MSHGFAADEKDHGSLDGLSDDDHSFYPKGLVAYDELTTSQGANTGSGIEEITGLVTTFTASSDRIYRVQIKSQWNATRGTGELRLWVTFDGGSNWERFMTTDLSVVGDTSYSEGTRYFDGTLNGSITAQAGAQDASGGDLDHQAAVSVPSFLAIEDMGPA